MTGVHGSQTLRPLCGSPRLRRRARWMYHSSWIVCLTVVAPAGILEQCGLLVNSRRMKWDLQKKESFHSTFTAVIQFYWHWCVLLFLVVLRHVSRWTLHWQTGEDSHGEFPEKAGWANQCHQKSQWGEEPPILLPVSRQNPKQCGCLSVRTWMVCMCGEVKEHFLHHLCLMLHFATDSLWKNIYCILKQS